MTKKSLIHEVSKYVIIFISGTFQTEDIVFLIWNLSNLDHNLFPDWNGMPYKCM